jgi:hypothetical protein
MPSALASTPRYSLRVSDERRQARSLDLQDDAPVAPPIVRDVARLVRDAEIFKEHAGAGLL